MMEETITRAFFMQLKDEDFQVREDYSGRGMYGATCLALVGGVQDLARFSAYVTNWLGSENGNDVECDERNYDWLWENIAMDNMGLQWVYYWPGVKVEDRKEVKKDAS